MRMSINGSLAILILLGALAAASIAAAAPKKPEEPPKPGEEGTILFSDKATPKKFKNKKARMAHFETKNQTEFKLKADEWEIHFQAVLRGKAKAKTLQLYFIDVTEDPMNEKPQTILQTDAKKNARIIRDKFILDTEDYEANMRLKLRVMRVKGRQATLLAEGEFLLKDEN